MWRRPTAEHSRERVGEGDRVALDRDVDVEALLSEQDVPDRSADDVDAVGEIRGARDRVDDGCEARYGAQLRCDAGRRLDGAGVAPSSSRSRSVRLTTPTSSVSRRIATRPSSAVVTSARSSTRGVSSSALTT